MRWSARTRQTRLKQAPIEINELLQVKMMEASDSLTYPSRVNDLVEGCLVIAWPTDRGVRLPIREQQQIWMSFVRQDAAYAFGGIVEEREQYPIPQLRVRPSGEPERIQRRQYFRVRTVVAVEMIGNRPDMPPGKPESAIHLRTHTYDLSGSGIAIRGDAPIPEGTTLEVKLTLPAELPPIKIVAKVVHSEILAGSALDKPTYHTGIYFLSITEPDRSRIIRYVFRVQQTVMGS